MGSAKKSHLVPTVVVNKNGVKTTVYRKPDQKAARSLATPVRGDAKSIHLLKKTLTERIKAYGDKYSWRTRVISSAVKKSDLQMLERLERYFDYSHDQFELAHDIMEKMGLDPNDEATFGIIIKAAGLTHLNGRELIDYIPLVLERPEEIERILDYKNINDFERLNSLQAEKITPEQLAELVNTEEETALPVFLHSSLPSTLTPVSDRRIIQSQARGMEDYYAYHFMKGWDQKTLSYVAEAIRSDAITKDQLLSIFTSDRFDSLWGEPRDNAVNIAAFLSIKDIINTAPVGVSKSPKGLNSRTFMEAAKTSMSARESVYEKYEIETAEDFAHYSALIRYGLTVPTEDWTARLIVMPSNRYSRESYTHNKEMVELLREYSEPHHVDTIVRFIADRGYENYGALRAHLEDHSAIPLGSGWL